MTNLDMNSFSDEQQKDLESLVDQVSKQVEETIEDSFEEKLTPGAQDVNYATSEDRKLGRRDSKNIRAFDRIWRSGGKLGMGGQKVSVEALFDKDTEVTSQMRDNFSTDHPLLLPRVVSNIAREAIEPNLVLEPLLHRINYSAGSRVVFPSWGAIPAAGIPEGGEYPERTMELAGQVEATIGKSGVAIKVSEEMVRYSQFDIIGLHVRAAGRALARWKEQKIADMITTNNSNYIFDNTATSSPSTTGRGLDGMYNGGLSLNDLFYAYAQMVDRGFTPNTLIMHPFAWQIFAQEGIARAFGFNNGVNPLMWQTARGEAGRGRPWSAGGLNQNSYVSSPGNIATTFTDVPTVFPTNFSIVVSPFMPYTASNQTTTIALCDTSEMGVMVVDEEVVTDEWEDKARDIRKIKFRERYGVNVLNDGKAIGLMVGIHTGRTVDFEDKITLAYGTGNVELLTGHNTAVV